MRRAPLAVFVLAALPLGSCALSTPPDFGSAAALGPVAIGDHLAVADPDRDALVVLDLDNGRLVGARRIALDGTPSLVMPVPGSVAALVLSSTDRRLDILSPDGNEHRSVALGAPFEGLAVSPDGDLAIAYYPPGTADAVFHNENEIALVDLTSDAPVIRRTLASLGGSPLSIHMSPRVGARRYAFVLSDEHVAVLALDDLTMPERSVPLVSLTSGGNRTPTGVAFATADELLWAIVSTQEASSVYALAIGPADFADLAGDPKGPDFAVRLSQLAGISPGGAATLVTLGPPDRRVLYTLTTSPAAGTLTLTDVATATGRTLTVQSGVDRLHVFSGEDGAAMALAWSSRDGFSFNVVDLAKMAAGANKAFETRSARDRFSELLPIPGTSRFIALHASTDEGVSVIDAATSRVTGFGMTGKLIALELVPNLGRLYLLTRLGADDFIVSVNLATLHPEAARVPEGADALAVLPGVTTVSTIAYRAGGRVTLWPALATGDDTTLAVPGFLLTGLFQR